MKWVTWENVGVGCMGCAWLIKRFIDPQAEFQFITPDQKTLPDDAEPFDIPGARLSHHRGHCSNRLAIAPAGCKSYFPSDSCYGVKGRQK